MSKKDAVKAGQLSKKLELNTSVKFLAGSDLARLKGSTTERVSAAFATASKKTGVFESRYAKK